MTNNLSKQLCELCGIRKEIDFTKPENLVKLFELEPSKTMKNLYSEVTDRTHHCCTNPWTNFRERFLKRLLIVVCSDIFISKDDREKIKNAIRNTEWNYG